MKEYCSHCHHCMGMKVVELKKQGLGYLKISRTLNRCPNSIKQYWVRYGLKKEVKSYGSKH